MDLRRSQELFKEAQRYLPGGVDSPVRAFKAVGGTPHFIKKGYGSHILDADDNEYIDYVGSWGPLILGHAHPQVVEAIHQAAENGTTFGASTELEVTLARMVTEAVPSIEMVRFVNSGTEATMSALRLARAFTGRDKIIKFDGGYHGHSDGLLVKAGSGLATLGLPDSPGVPRSYTQNTLVAPYNNIEAVAQLFKSYHDEIAAIIVEPVAANMGIVPPQPGFLDGLRKLTSNYGALLVFDEVITGFRVAYGGAQAVFNITPDLTCLGKIIGGGLPVGAFGGKREIMEMVAPEGKVYQAGTLSGNPLAMAAGIATLKVLGQPGVWQNLEKSTQKLARGIGKAANDAGIPVWQNSIGTMFATFFTENPVKGWPSAKLSDTEVFGKYFMGMLERGVYLAPSQFESGFMSTAHTDAEIQATLQAVEETFKAW